MHRNKKILTLEDLVHFCESGQLTNFSSKESGYQLCVQVPATFEQEENEDNTLLFAFVRLFHIGRNRNQSSVTREAAEKCLSGIKYKPVLANFCTVNGEEDFTSHDMEFDEDGNVKYIERQVGCFTADEPYIQYVEEYDKEYVFAKIAIPREYTTAAEIIERKIRTKISVELLINAMQYNANDKILELTDIIVQGATLLGKDPDTGKNVEEGMIGSKASIHDFSKDINSICSKFSKENQNNKLIDLLENLNSKLDAINSNINKNNGEQFAQEGGNETNMNKFEELLSKYNVSVEDITFEYEDMSDEELETKFAEVFEQVSDDDDDFDEPDDKTVTDDEPDDSYVKDDDETKQKCSLQINDKTYSFELSAQDKISALYSLVNDTYSDADNTWYSVLLYDEYIVMQDWCSNAAYKQFYVEVDGKFALTGERVQVYANYLTREEEVAIEEMRSNYSSIETELNQYKEAELETQRQEIVSDEVYAEFAEEDCFVEIRNNISTYSLDALRQACDLALASCYKNVKKQFSVEEPLKKPNKIGISYSADEQVERDPYGDYFAFLKR